MTTMIDIDPCSGYMVKTKDDVKRLIAENNIEMIRLEFADLHGINRGKLVPANMVDALFEPGISFCAAIMIMGFDNAVAEVKGLSENNYDDLSLIADPSTFVILPYLEKTAMMLGDVYYHHKPMSQAPRWFLKNMITKYQELGFNPISASELEFFLFNKSADGCLKPYTNKLCNCYTANTRMDPLGFLNKMTNTLKNMDFTILYMNHEYYPGQYEYNWSHCQALRNADETSLFKGIAKEIADQNGLFTTFMAKPKNDNGGSGCHFHISLNDLNSGDNIFYDPQGKDEMSDVMKQFIAGVIKHARPLTALLSPTINCYKRYRLDSFAPVHIGWGYDNRTTYVRIPEDRGKATRVEVRAGSAAANPYLALGGILAAGLDGIMNHLELPPAVTTDLYHDSDRQVEMVPRSLFRALTELEQDEWLCDCLGKELVTSYIALKQMEVDNYTYMVTDWEWDNYAYHI